MPATMPVAAATDPPDNWISGLQARRILGVGYSGLQRLAVLGKIGTLVEPGIPPQYNRSDVARIAGSRAGTAPTPTGSAPAASIAG